MPSKLVPTRVQNKDAAQAYIEWMATPEEKREPPTKKSFAKYLGISRDSLYRWERTEWFQTALRVEVKKYLAEKRRAVYESLLNQAIEEENIAAIRHYSQIMGDQVQQIDVHKTEETIDSHDARKMSIEELVKKSLEENIDSPALERRLEEKNMSERELLELVMVLLES